MPDQPTVLADQPDSNAKLDGYLKLYERQMAHYEKTQEIEWKVSIGVWTLLAVGIAWAATNGFLRGLTAHLRLVAVLATLFFPVAHAWWLWRVHDSEDFDKRLWSYYRAHAVAILTGEPLPEGWSPLVRRSRKNRLAWLGVEAGITLVLAVVMLYVLLS